MKKRIIIILMCLTLVCALTACNLAELEMGGLIGELLGDAELPSGDPSDSFITVYPTPNGTDISVLPPIEIAPDDWTEDSYIESETAMPSVDLPQHAYAEQRLTLLGVLDSDLGIDDSVDIVQSLSYNRNVAMKNVYSLEVDTVLVESDDELARQVRNDVTADGNAYHLIFGTIYQSGAELTQIGCLANLNNLPWVDLTHSRWDEDIYNGFAIGNYLPMATGAITPDATMKTAIIAFNPNIANQMGLDMYDYVQTGGWTLEKMLSISEEVYADLNGDGLSNPTKDRFGFVGNFTSAQAFACGTGAEVIVKGENHLPMVNVQTEQLRESFAVVYKLVHARSTHYVPQSTVLQDYDQLYAPAQTFAQGRALFCATNVEQAMTLIEDSQAFGILPYPCWEMDGEYHSLVDFSATALMVHKGMEDEEFAGYALEAMAQVSEQVYPDRIAMKICTSPNDAEMLQLVLDTKTFDFGSNYFSKSRGDMVWLFRHMIETGQTDVGSLLTKNQKVLQKEVLKIQANYE